MRPDLPKTEKGRRTRERLLRGASIAVGKYGYQGLRIDQIAAEADVPVGLFYRYFRGKSDITLEVLQLMLTEFRASVPAPMAGVPFWYRELALHRNFVLLFGQGKTGLLGCYFSDSFGEAAFQAFFADQTHRFVEEHSAAVRAALGNRRVREAELHLVALALVSMTESLLYRFFTGREALSSSAAVQNIDFVWLLAAMRHRGFLLIDPPRPQLVDLARFRRPREARRPTAIAASPGSERTFRQKPKRADSQVSLARVREATLRLLNSLGYDDLRIEDIEQESGVTRGVVYYHFVDKRELIHTVLLDRLDQLTARLLAVQAGWPQRQSPYVTLLSVALTMAEELCPTPGLLRALYIMEERDQEFASEYRKRRSTQIAVIGSAVAGHLELAESDSPALEFMATAFLAMAERLLYDVYVARLSDTAAIRTSRTAAELLAALWHRMAFLANPPARDGTMFQTLTRLDASSVV
jgi:AcrR family transcriptional regulator